MSRPTAWLWLAAAFVVLGCTDLEAGQGTDDSTAIEPQTNWQRDLVATDLQIDLETRQATAVIRLDAAAERGASFEVGDLTIQAVRGPAGPIKHRVSE